MILKVLLSVLCSMVCLTLSRSETVIPPLIKSQADDDIIFVLHENITLPCQATGYPSPRYYWIRDGMVVYANDAVNNVNDDIDISMFSGNDINGDLLLTAADAHAQGIYYCWAKNEGGTDRSRPINLTMAYLNQFISQPEQRPIPLDSYAYLECPTPESNPTPEITWYIRRGRSTQFQPISVSENVVIDSNKNLHILSFGVDNVGEYTCSATNKVIRSKVQSQPITLYISQSDSDDSAIRLVHKSPEVLLALVGGSVTLECLFHGQPPPMITWERPGMTSIPERWRTSLDGGSIIIDDVEVSDEGVYQCLAFNEVSPRPVQYQITLEVQTPPVFTIVPKSQNVTRGSVITLTCAAEGIPPPDIYLTIDWVDIYRPDTDENQVTSQSNASTTTTVFHVTPADLDSGMVIGCLAGNFHGDIYTSSYISISDTVAVVGSTASVSRKPMISLMISSFIYSMCRFLCLMFT